MILLNCSMFLSVSSTPNLLHKPANTSDASSLPRISAVVGSEESWRPVRTSHLLLVSPSVVVAIVSEPFIIYLLLL